MILRLYNPSKRVEQSAAIKSTQIQLRLQPSSLTISSPSTSLNFGQRCFRIFQEQVVRRLVGVDREHHALAAVAIWCPIGLFAVEEPGLIVRDGEVKWLQLGDIQLVNVLEIGVDGGAGQLLAGVLERGLGQSVIGGAEIEVNSLAWGDFGKVGGAEL